MPTTLPTTLLTTQLDRFEANLPPLPARVFRLQRTLTGAAVCGVVGVVTRVGASTATLIDIARVSGKTVTGQARAAGEDVLTTARTGARTVRGQAGAQGRNVSSAVTSEATALLDDAIDTVEDVEDGAEPGRGTPYEEWTKAELLERAKDLDIEGRSALNKQQLIRALRSA